MSGIPSIVNKNKTSNKLSIHYWKGLPGCGKSTEARELMESSAGKYKCFNKDDLRESFDLGEWSKENERFIIEAQDTLIKLALKRGFSVLIPDTNLASKHADRFKEIAREFSAELVLHDLTNISVEECIKRDLKRNRSVGKDVIMKIYRDFLEPSRKIYEHLPGLKNCIIVDIDGTVAKAESGRNMYDWKRVGEDLPNKPVIKTIRDYLCMNPLTDLVFMSGRDEICRKETEEWLRKYFGDFKAVYMRPQGSFEKDVKIKNDLYYKWINGRYNIEAVYDDRQQVVDFWRSLGLQVYQVDRGDF